MSIDWKGKLTDEGMILCRNWFELYSTRYLAKMLTALGYDDVSNDDGERDTIMTLLYDALPIDETLLWLKENQEYIYPVDFWTDDPVSAMTADGMIFLSPQKSTGSFMRNMNDGYCTHIPMLLEKKATLVGFTPIGVNLSKPNEAQISKNVFSYIDEEMKLWLCAATQIRHNGQILEYKTTMQSAVKYGEKTEQTFFGVFVRGRMENEESPFDVNYMLQQVSKERSAE